MIGQLLNLTILCASQLVLFNVCRTLISTYKRLNILGYIKSGFFWACRRRQVGTEIYLTHIIVREIYHSSYKHSGKL